MFEIMLSIDNFNTVIDEFCDILGTHLLSSGQLRVLYCKVCQTIDGNYIKMVIKLNYTISIIISFDKFYQVPVLYFQVYETKDYDEMVQLTNIEDLGIVQKFTQLSIDNHPIEPGIFFLIHPCETLSTLDTFIKDTQVMDTKDTSEQRYLKYLITWNTIYGTGIFSDLYLKYNLYKST